MDSAADGRIPGGTLIITSNRAAAAALAAFLLPSIAVAARLYPVEFLSEYAALPLIVFVVCAGTALLLVVEEAREISAGAVFMLASVPPLFLAAWLDGAPAPLVLQNFAGIVICIFFARVCSKLTNGAAAGLLWTAAQSLPPLLWFLLDITNTRRAAPSWRESVAAASPLFAAVRGDLQSLVIAGTVTFVAGFAAFYKHRRR